jgi:hypothetical protein
MDFLPGIMRASPNVASISRLDIPGRLRIVQSKVHLFAKHAFFL